MSLQPFIKQTILSPHRSFQTGEVFYEQISGYRLGDSDYFAMKAGEDNWRLVHYPTGLRIGRHEHVSTRGHVVDSLVPAYEDYVKEQLSKRKDLKIINH